MQPKFEEIFTMVPFCKNILKKELFPPPPISLFEKKNYQKILLKKRKKHIHQNSPQLHTT